MDLQTLPMRCWGTLLLRLFKKEQPSSIDVAMTSYLHNKDYSYAGDEHRIFVSFVEADLKDFDSFKKKLYDASHELQRPTSEYEIALDACVHLTRSRSCFSGISEVILPIFDGAPHIKLASVQDVEHYGILDSGNGLHYYGLKLRAPEHVISRRLELIDPKWLNASINRGRYDIRISANSKSRFDWATCSLK